MDTFATSFFTMISIDTISRATNASLMNYKCVTML